MYKIYRKPTISRFNVVVKNPDGSISIRKGSRSDKAGVGNTDIAVKRNKRPKAKIDAKSAFTEGKVTLSLPLVTVSEANCSEFWKTQNDRHQAQKAIVAMILNPVKDRVKLPCHIKLSRLAPRKLDKADNLPTSMKYILDACCAIITGDFRPGRADSDERISVSYDQKKSSAYGVEVEFTF